MKLGFLGDSITEGYGASSLKLNYVSLVGQMLDCEVVNCGIGGTRIARQKANSYFHRHDIDFNLRTPLLNQSLDKLFVFGGTNDYGHGDATWGNKGDTDCYTFHGALYTLFSSLLEKFGKEKVVIMLPLKRAFMNTFANPVTGKYLVDYVNTIKEYADEFGFKYIDLFNDGLPEPPEGQSEFFIDGLHPNDKGYKIIAEKICNFIKNDK